jgi:hypothetical protein
VGPVEAKAGHTAQPSASMRLRLLSMAVLFLINEQSRRILYDMVNNL